MSPEWQRTKHRRLQKLSWEEDCYVVGGMVLLQPGYQEVRPWW